MGKYKKFGGNWTEKKLRVLEKYVRAYLTIMKKQNFETVYIDGFAGYCKIETEDPKEDLLFEDIIKKTRKIYEGSVYRILKVSLREPELSFNKYVFIDDNKECIEKIRKVLKKEDIILENSKIFLVNKDINFALKKILPVLNNPRIRGFMFLDPFGMTLNWDTLKHLEKITSDLWILIPSGVAINRLLTKNGIPKESSLSKLSSFFGLSKETIIKKFYREDDSLFEGEKKIIKYADCILKSVQLYSEQLQKIGYKVSQPIELRNTKGAIMFHFIAASKKEVAIKIANDIIKKEEKENVLFKN